VLWLLVVWGVVVGLCGVCVVVCGFLGIFCILPQKFIRKS